MLPQKRKTYIFVALNNRPRAYFIGCDPILVESVAWHSLSCDSTQAEKYEYIVCATRPNDLGFVPGRFYRVCACCWYERICGVCGKHPDNAAEPPACECFLMGTFNTDRRIARSLYFARHGWFPADDVRTLMSWPLEMYQRVLTRVHLVKINDSNDPEQDHFDVDARRLELWAERRANRSRFMLYLVLAARASGCDLPRDLVRATSDLAWPLPLHAD